ncbi:MAG: PAS domain S-box protein, partial [Nitrospinae bacterium]|nr:PAS domain S-box protein [Nitrospinota bacterium]
NIKNSKLDDLVTARTSLLEERTKALEESERKYRSLIESAGDAIFLADAVTGYLIDCNRKAEELVGRPKSEIVGMHQSQLHPSDMADEYREIFRNHVKTGKPIVEDLVVVHKDGRYIPVDIRAAMFEIQGKLFVQGIFRDITERKLARKETQEALSRLHKIASRLPGVVYQLRLRPDGSFCFPYASDALRDICRVRPEEVLDDAAKAFAAVHPDDFGPLIASVHVSAKGLSLWQQEFRLKFDDGVERWLLGNALPEREEDGGTLWHGVITDITERKRAEQELRQTKERYDLASSVGKVGTWDWDILTGRLIWSEEVYRIMGLPAGEVEPSYEIFLSRVHPDDQKLFGDSVTDALENKKPFNAEYRIVRRDGKESVCHAIGNVTFDGGKPVRMMGTFQDITERVMAEEERKSFEAKLQHVQKLESLGVLAGGIAHDFNNLLTSILGNADLAMMDLPSTSPARPQIEDILTTSRKAADLTRQMLAYSGKGKFVISKVNLNNVITEMNQLLRVSVLKNVLLKYDFAENLPPLKADVTQMNQLIMNLVINASEAIGGKNGSIAIRTGATHCDRVCLESAWGVDNLQEGLYVTLEVADTGIGMTKETIAKIFEPFFTTKFTGRGLGMSAVQGIVRGHHGAIRIYSEPGKGTTFKILLPAANEAPDAVHKNGADSSAWVGHGSVLLIDDEEAVRSIGSKMLVKTGFTVIAVADGVEALKIFRDRPGDFAFILLDLTMPRMSGEECFRELRKINPDARIIMTSGYNEQDVTQRFVGKGLTGFLAKPFQISNMKDVIKQIV